MRSVRRRYHTVSVVSFSLLWAAFVFLFVLISSDAFAAPVTYETVRVGPGQYAPTGTTSPVTFNVKTPGVSKFHQIVPVATPSTLGKLARKTLRGGGVGLAVGAAIEGLGYLIDKATGDIKKEVTVLGNPTGNSGWGQNMSVQTASLNQVSALVSFCAGAQFCSIHYKTPNVSAEARRWNCSNPSYPIGYNFNSPTSAEPAFSGRCYVATSTIPETTTIVELDPSDYEIIDNKLNTALSLAEKTAIIKNAIATANPSGTVNSDNYPVAITGNSAAQQFYSDWPEFRTLLQQLVNAETAAYLATVQPEFEVAPGDQAIVDDGTDFAPPDLDTPTLELPAFCEWATFICAPFVGGDQPEVPMLDLEAPNYDSGLPQTASCPAPVVIETQWFGSLNLSYEPACEFASGIRVPLLAISYLVSGFIVVGVRR